ncbi:hypothetical protein ABI125_06805 [Tamlana crocina]
MQKNITLALIGLLILNCSKENDNLNPNVIGTWNWVSSSGGIMGNTENPESTGNERKLEISADSLYFYLNGQLNYKTKYSIEVRESIIFNEPRTMIVNETGFKKIIDFNGDTLLLTGDCYDCYVNEYIKQ